MIFRPATRADLKVIVDLDMRLADLHHSFDPLHRTGKESRKHFLSIYSSLLRKKNSIVLLAIEGTQAVGFLSGEMTEADPFIRLKRVAEIEAIHVLQSTSSRVRNSASKLI